jgi:hypothetical protein
MYREDPFESPAYADDRPKPLTSPVDDAMLSVRKELSNLDDATAALFDRLAPVLRPDRSVRSDTEEAVPERSPLVASLEGMADMIRDHALALRGLMGRMDV